MYVMTVLARYLSSSDNLAPVAGRRINRSAENPANVIIRPAKVYKRVAPFISMFAPPENRGCRSRRRNAQGVYLGNHLETIAKLVLPTWLPGWKAGAQKAIEIEDDFLAPGRAVSRDGTLM